MAPQLKNDNMFFIVVDMNWWYVITRGQMNHFSLTFLSQLNCFVIIDIVRIELLIVERYYVVRLLSKLANLVKEWESVVSHHMLLWCLLVQVVIQVTHLTYDGLNGENYFCRFVLVPSISRACDCIHIPSCRDSGHWPE